MNKRPTDEFQETIQAIASLISKSEKVKQKLIPGTWQHTRMLENLRALSIASALMGRKTDTMEVPTQEELQAALHAFAGMTAKSERAQTKFAPGTSQHTLLQNRLRAFRAAEAQIRANWAGEAGAKTMLTDSEYRYLRRNTRRFKMTPDEATAALGAVGVPLLPAFLAFQTAFGGYCPDDDVTYGIVGPGGDDEGEPRVRKQGTLQLVRCDLHNRTQIRLYLDPNGVFYQEQTPVAESFESYIAFAAYGAQTLQPFGWTYIDPERRATKRFRALSEKWEPAPVVPRVTDPYHAVYQGPQYFEIVLGDDRQLFVRPDLLKG